MKKSKSELITELNQFLLIDNLPWNRLPAEELERIHSALVCPENG